MKEIEMNKEELIELLKESLSLDVRVSEEYGMYSGKNISIEVRLNFEDQQITSSHDYFSINNDD